jgi:outer membrane lipoprotein carrier protein
MPGPGVQNSNKQLGELSEMKIKIILLLLFVFVVFDTDTGFSADTSRNVSSPATGGQKTLGEILDNIEKRYAGIGFSARFDQSSTIKAMEITDTASGKIFVKRPGKMRWEYEEPDKQTIITDSKTLWIYRPNDNQVMIGKAPVYFADGKGASFLSDMNLIRKKFSISLEAAVKDDTYYLKLLPQEKKIDLSVIYLSISKTTFDIIEIVTYNLYEDETRIRLSQVDFKQNLDDSMFQFNIPEGTDVLELEE